MAKARTPARRPAPPATIKITVNLPRDTVDTVKLLARKRGVTNTELIRRAIAAEKFLDDVISAGHKVLFRDEETGDMRELVFL